MTSTSHERYLAALPSDWTTTTVAALGSVCGGSTPSRAVSRFWEGDIPWVTPGELTNLGEKYLRSTRERISGAGLAACGAQLLPAETLLVTSRATIGSVALAGMQLTTNQGFKSVVFRGHSDPNFYYHLFSRSVPELVRRASGTTFLEISSREFSAVVLPLPPLPEQQQIAEILDTVDEAIRKTEQIIAKLEQVKQGLLHDLLTRGIDDNGELRDPERHPEQFKDSELGRIPRAWEVERMASLTTRIVDGVHHTPTYVGSGVPFLTVENLSRGPGISWSPSRFISPRAHAEYIRRAAPGPGDLLVSKDGTLGVARVVPRDVPDFSIFVSIALLCPNRSKVRVGWLKTFFDTSEFVRQLGRQSAGSGLQHIHLEHFREFLVPVSPIAEQDRILDASRNIEALLRSEAAGLTKLRLLKAGLMEDLLTGRVRVPLAAANQPA